MHRAGVAHLDLTSKNVCVRRRGERVRATIIDFGLARFRKERDFEEGKEFDLLFLSGLAQEVRGPLLQAPARRN